MLSHPTSHGLRSAGVSRAIFIATHYEPAGEMPVTQHDASDQSISALSDQFGIVHETKGMIPSTFVVTP
jgi:hypothetical protein